jgi:hypothetical protein
MELPQTPVTLSPTGIRFQLQLLGRIVWLMWGTNTNRLVQASTQCEDVVALQAAQQTML